MQLVVSVLSSVLHSVFSCPVLFLFHPFMSLGLFLLLSYRKIPGNQCEGGFQPDRKETDLRRMCISNALYPNSLVGSAQPEKETGSAGYTVETSDLLLSALKMWMCYFVAVWHELIVQPNVVVQISRKSVKESPDECFHTSVTVSAAIFSLQWMFESNPSCMSLLI